MFILTYVLPISCFSFSLHLPLAPCWFGIDSLLQFSPFCLFLFFGWGNEERYVDLGVVEKMSQLQLGCCPFSVIPKLGTTHFCSPFQNRLFLLITDRELKTYLNFPWQLPARDFMNIYFIKINDTLLRGHFFSLTHPECSIQKLQGCPYPLGMGRKRQRGRKMC